MAIPPPSRSFFLFNFLQVYFLFLTVLLNIHVCLPSQVIRYTRNGVHSASSGLPPTWRLPLQYEHFFWTIFCKYIFYFCQYHLINMFAYPVKCSATRIHIHSRATASIAPPQGSHLHGDCPFSTSIFFGQFSASIFFIFDSTTK